MGEGARSLFLTKSLFEIKTNDNFNIIKNVRDIR